MQPELLPIAFVSEAEVRSNAESRRTEEISGLLRSVFQGWAARFRQSEPLIFSAVSHSRKTARVGN